MWSTNRKVDLLVNVLIFLVSINFFHIGQLLLPVICLILFVDNKLKFKVNSIKVFILLCLFGLTFCLFSFKLGFYCVMGFCLPMAYYIGSNIKKIDEDSIKKIAYIIALGMASHVLLNMVYSRIIIGETFYETQGHYDIWLGSKVSDTATAVNYVFIIGSLYYVLFYENRKSLKVLFSIIFLVIMAYDMFLGRRTPILMSFITFVLTTVIDFIFYHNSKRNKRILMIVLCSILILVIVFIIIYKYFLSDWGRVLIYYSTLFSKFRREGLSSGRLQVLIDTIKLMPYHIWGGQEITNILEVSPHDLLLDTYDYAGIIPFVLMFVYVTHLVKVLIDVVKNRNVSREMKILIISLSLSISMQLCLEPIMSGASNFLMIVIILVSSIEKALLNGK